MASVVQQKREAVLKRWIDAIIASYPAETAQIMQRSANRFANPVAHVIATAAATALDGLLAGADDAALAAAMDELMRVRAVQNFSASAAVGVVFGLKDAVGSEFDPASGEIREFFGKIDHLALVAFDVYAKCREQLYQVRLNDALGRPSAAAKRASCPPGDCASCDPDARNSCQ